ncbi:class I SAM-dependent methyltransferase [Marinomonas sp. THO17]|uniref:class I SAM-dependent methyltransferase n=1 Tax=Marinomonas sp. THO17 TaxID=3149048 RepID=UPI00336C2B87
MTSPPFSVLTDQVFKQFSQKSPQLPNQLHRLFHGRGRCFSGLEQITVDYVAGHILVSLYKTLPNDQQDQLLKTLLNWPHRTEWQDYSVKSILIQYRYQDRNPTELIWGKLDPNPVAYENDLAFQMSLGRNQNTGLFLDMRYGRRWVKENSQDKSVLNLFSYTCGFSVAALSGGAKSVINFDMAKAALNRGRDNHKLNQQDMTKVKFFAHDILKSWGKINKYGPYDLIIIDPPSFQKGSFALTKDYQKILRRLPDLITPSGQVLACANDPSIDCQFVINAMHENATDIEFQQRLQNPPEFPDIDEESSLKALIFKKKTN